ncbi:MAG TPA: methyltransferase domain-containing protein [bacterium]|jgi:2-polyprenyl-3-methyl-5-hydroxy-6-metoxy-1,4-benzoquinol methylase/GT2 family glycosyltransferase/glycosyltransferase involved in cell wall biosynthesis
MNIDPKTGIWQGADRHRVYDQTLAASIVDFCRKRNFKTVVDLGCGAGYYVQHLKDGGLDCSGYDGNPNTPQITEGLCGVLDLSKPIDIGTRSCVVSLEVGEHIPAEFQEVYITNLLKTATDYLIVSWAIPGQGGLGHYNERPLEEIIRRIERDGVWRFDKDTALYLRSTSTLPWFKNTVLCFENIKVSAKTTITKGMRDFQQTRQLNDEAFRRRMKVQPEALTLAFWENHFCTKEACESTELQGRILDFGCGTGEIDILMARHGREVVGYDISQIALDTAKDHLAKEPQAVQNRLRFVLGAGNRLPFEDQSFDSVFCNHVLEHIAHPTPILKDLARVLKPGGALLVQVPDGLAYYDVMHLRFFHAETLESLLGDFFEEVDVVLQPERKQLKAVCRNRTATRHPRIICTMRIRNEERWIKEVFDSVARVADGIVVLDDGSSDHTPEICAAHPAVVDYRRLDEATRDQRRDKMLALQMAIGQQPDWILNLDGDEMLEESAAQRIFDAVRTCPPDVGVFKIESLFMWNDLEHYRTDGVYNQLLQARMFRLKGQDVYALHYEPTTFRENGHCTRLPAGIRGRETDIDVKIIHLGYMYPEVRARRYDYYRTRDPKEFARGDYDHLLDQPHQVLAEWHERPWGKAKSEKSKSDNSTVARTLQNAATKQEFKPDYYYANARKNLCDLVPVTAKRVLDVGCGHGMTGGLLRAERGIEVVGIEIHEAAAAVARQHLSSVVVGDLETMELPLEKASFDCLLLGDVLEHLVNPWLALKKLTQYLKPSGSIVASIPNIRNLGVMKKVLEGSWSYEEWGILDKTHLRFFALKDMQALFEQAGIEAKVVEIVRDPLFEQEMQTLPEAATDVRVGPLLLRAVSPADLNELTAQQFIFTGTLKDAPLAQAPKRIEPVPEVSVIIPVFNNLNYTRQCITSLFTVKEAVPFEVVVVDNGSTDDTAQYLAELPSIVRTVSCGENLGFAKGCNAGAKAARGKHLVFLNNDTTVLPHWLSAMLDCQKKDPSIGLVGNLQIFPESGMVQQAGIICGADNMVRSIYNNELPSDHPAVNTPREFQFVAGSCMLIEKGLFEQLGGFDEAYLNSCEDIDLCMKVREAGRKVFYCPASRIYHYESRTVKGHDKSGGNYRLFLKRWGGKLVRDDEKYLREDGFLREPPPSESPAKEAESVSCPKPVTDGDQPVKSVPAESLRVALLTTYNQHCGLATYAEFLVAAMQAQGTEPVILSEKNVPLRGADASHVVRCWTREANGGDELVAQIHRLGITLLHVNHGGMFALDGWLPSVLRAVRAMGVRVVVTFHSTECTVDAMGELVRLADRALVHHAQNELELIATGGTPGRMDVIPHGMPAVESRDLFESKLDLQWDPAKKVVSTFGFVEPHKGVLELIEAMKPVHATLGADLHVLGGPHPANPDSQDYLNACKQKAADLGLTAAVHFAGTYLSDEEIARRLRASDVIVMNYRARRFESSGAAMIALASGRPVVSSSVPTFDFAPALTYKTTDLHHLTLAIHETLTNPFIARTLLRNVREFEATARWDRVGRRVLDVYRAVLNAPPQSDVNMMHYYRSHPDDIYNEPLQRERVQWLKSRAQGRILEIGPANGYVSESVGGSAAVDINRGRLAVAQALRPSVHFQYGDVVKGLPFARHEFDTVLAPEILEHVEFEDAVCALRECARVGRRVLVTVPNADKPNYDPALVHNVEHRWLVNRETVDRLLAEAGCTSYELDTSPENDFYLLDIRTDEPAPRAVIRARAVELAAHRLTLRESLNVGIDASALDTADHAMTDGQLYAWHVVNEWMAARLHWNFTVFGNGASPLSPAVAQLAQHARGGYLPAQQWASRDLDCMYLCDPMDAQADKMLGSLLVTSPLVAAAFEDLVPLRFADAYLKSAPDYKGHYLHLLRLLKERCDLFLCPSQSTAQDLQAYLEIPHGRLRIVHGAPVNRQQPERSRSEQVMQRLGLGGKKFFLSIGNAAYRENLAGSLFALSAARHVTNEDVRLVIAGEITDMGRKAILAAAQDCALPSQALAFTTRSDAAALRGEAQALLNPSLWEGSARSLLDAMQSGLPVIAGNNSAQVEICGDAALMIAAENSEEIARAMLSIVQNPALREDLSQRGKAQAQRFTWRKAAEKTAVYVAESLSRRRQPERRMRPQGQPVQ